MTNMTEGVHTTTNPKSTGWVNQANGVVLSAHDDKRSALKEGRLLAKGTAPSSRSIVATAACRRRRRMPRARSGDTRSSVSSK
jgi:hypothetical protein